MGPPPDQGEDVQTIAGKATGWCDKRHRRDGHGFGHMSLPAQVVQFGLGNMV